MKIKIRSAKKIIDAKEYDYDKEKWVVVGKKEVNRYSLPYRVRKKIFKARNVTFNPDTFRAYSYDWWRFVDKVNGKIVFNFYRYSSVTTKHQWTVLSLLRELKIKIDYHVGVRTGLQDVSHGAISDKLYQIGSLRAKIAHPKSKKDANDHRKLQIKALEKELLLLTKLYPESKRYNTQKLRDERYKNAFEHDQHERNRAKLKRIATKPIIENKQMIKDLMQKEMGL